jgi:cytochrome c
MKFTFFQKFGAAVLIAIWMVWGSHMIGETLIPRFEMPKAVASASRTATKRPAPEPAEIEDIGPLLASVSMDDGESAFKKCKACHTIDKGDANKVGPNLWDIVGHDRAARDGFAYSDAFTGLDGTWTYEELNAFLAKPKAYAPGTKMSFAGMKKVADRAAVIGYLRAQSDMPQPLP